MNKPNPTKTQEIEILKAAIEQLGEDSYLGPLLQQLLPEIEDLIRSDFYPTIIISAQAAAQAEAAKIKEEAEKDVEAQYKRLAQARADLSSVLFDVARRAEGLANSVSVA